MTSKSFNVAALFTLMLWAFGCGEKDSVEETAAELETGSSVLAMEAYAASLFEDVDDLSVVVLNTFADPDGRTAGLDERLGCASFTFLPGSITVDFEDGCTVNSIERKGKVIITHQGETWSAGSTFGITFEGFSVNGIGIEGSRMVTNLEGSTISSPRVGISLSDGVITFPDGSFLTRTSERVRSWSYTTDPGDVHIVVEAGSTASGVGIDGKSYATEVTADLLYKLSCIETDHMILPVGGSITLQYEGKSYAVDFGSGACDTMVELTTPLGFTQQFDVSELLDDLMP